MFENPYVTYLILKERQRDFLSDADKPRFSRSASGAERTVLRELGSGVLCAVGRGMVRLGLRLQGVRPASTIPEA